MAQPDQSEISSVQRHKTAIRRAGWSRPVSCLLRDGLVDGSKTLFDYGCGRGQDLALLRDMGVGCSGWDPAHLPQADRSAADIVNLGYVINVIEDPLERNEALKAAWQLCRSLLVVAAQINLAAPDREQTRFGDGVITTRGTFQKYYTQGELRSYLESELAADPIPAAPGVFYVFRDETSKQQYLANRYRRSISVPPQRVSEALFEQHRALLEPLMEAVTRRGRLPGPEELPETAAIVERLGSLKRAFAVVARVTDAAPWKTIAKRRTEDLLIYLALARFQKRPILSKLSLETQRDVKAFFGTYQRACDEADTLLFSVADAAAIDQACQRARLGQLVENALLISRPALSDLEPLLRVYEGCARALVGEIEDANVVKLHRFSGKVTYLCYRDFETAALPELQLRVKVSLRTLDIGFYDYSRWDVRPVLEERNAVLRRAFDQPTGGGARRHCRLSINTRLPALAR